GVGLLDVDHGGPVHTVLVGLGGDHDDGPCAAIDDDTHVALVPVAAELTQLLGGPGIPVERLALAHGVDVVGAKRVGCPDGHVASSLGMRLGACPEAWCPTSGG